jgi:hypothetical protein
LVRGPVSGTFDLSLADAKLVGGGAEGVSSVSGAGDVDGDGLDDVLAAGGGDSRAGAAYMVLGPVTGTLDLPVAADATLVGEEPDDAASSVSGAGDVDGEGHDDILVGAPLNDEGGARAGAVYLVLGPATGTVDLAGADAQFVGEAVDEVGFDLGLQGTFTGAGDVDGDGQDDIVLGAYQDGDGGTAYLFYGGGL